MSGPYDDILRLPHPTSKKHPRMDRADRAAQFSPFAALTGYGDVVAETARLTDGRVELTEDEIAALDARLRLAMETDCEVTVTWFRPDEKKSGGSYVATTGCIKKADPLSRLLVMDDGAQIPVDDIVELDSEIFDRVE